MCMGSGGTGSEDLAFPKGKFCLFVLSVHASCNSSVFFFSSALGL